MAWRRFFSRPRPRTVVGRQRRAWRPLLESLEGRRLLVGDTLAGNTLAGNGLLGQYYADATFGTLAFARVDPGVAADWGTGSPDAALGSDAFSVRWSGQVEAKFTETYSFSLNTADAARLWVNGRLLVDGFAAAGSGASGQGITGQGMSGTIDLVAGRRYDVVLEYAETGGAAAVSLRWSSASQAVETIPATQLFASQRGGLTRETWAGIAGGTIASLTSAPAYPASPSTVGTIGSGAAPSDVGDAYGSRLRGFLTPPTSGDYRFAIAGDDAAELWLSADGSPESRQRIAFLDAATGAATGPREWNTSPTQRSVSVPLVAGQSYYLEALHKESTGSDSLAIGWMRPGAADFEPIPGEFLAPVAPVVSVYADVPTMAEGSPSPARLSIVRSGPTTAPLTVAYTLQGSATNGVDYARLPGTVTIPAGQAAVTLELTALADATVEGTEQVVVELKQAPGYTVDLRSMRTATIALQDDVAVPGGGTSLLAGTDRASFLAYGGTFSTVTDATRGSTIQAVIASVPSAPSNAQLRQTNAAPVVRGDTIFVEFWVRSVTPSGQLLVVFEQGVSPYAKSLMRNIVVDTNWTKVQVPFQSGADYAVGQASFGLQLGYRVQTLEFAGFRVTNFGPSPDLFPVAGLFLGGGGTAYGSLQSVDVTGQSFATASRLTTVTKPANTYRFQAVAANAAAVASGDTITVTYLARSVAGANPRINAVLQERFGSYTSRYSATISPTSAWQQYSYTVVTTRAYAVGELQIAFNVGYDPQTVEVGGVTWRDSSRVDVGALPTRVPATTYGGRSGTDSWRSAADARIAADRMADLTVNVIDANGRAIPGAVVAVRQQRQEFRFGTAVSTASSLLSPTGGPDAVRYQALLKRLFNTAVLENAMKWPEVLADRQNALTAAQWIVDAGLELRGHTAVWPSRSVMPAAVWAQYDAMLASQGAAAAAASLRAAVEARVIDMADTFAGQTFEWDVVNEPYANHAVMDVLGDAAVLDWYRLFRQHDPSARLALNDYSIFARNGGDTEHRANFDAWLDRLKAASLVDVIGEQSHYSEAVLTDIDVLGRLIASYRDRYSLPIAITEYDLTTTDEQLQADYLRDYMTMAFSQPGTDEFVQWGFWSGVGERPEARLYRTDFSPKPAGQAYEDLVFGDWWTDVRGTTFDGSYATRAFRGTYAIDVTYGGTTRTLTATVTDPAQTLAVQLPGVVLAPPAAPQLALGAGVGLAPDGGATRTEAGQASGVVTVAGDPGATLSVTFAGVGGSVVRTLVAAGGREALVLDAAEIGRLGDGLVVVSARQSRLADNPSPTATLSFTLDTGVPAAPLVALAAAATGGVTQAEAAAGVLAVTCESAATIAVTFAGRRGTVVRTLTGGGAAQPVALTADEVARLGDGAVGVTAVQTDAAGNASPLAVATFSLDTTAPTVAIACGAAAVRIGGTATLTFTLDESSTTFTAADVAVVGGTLTAFAGAGRDYSATFVPAAGFAGTASVAVAADAFTDAAGNGNVAASLAAPPAVDTVVPTIAIATSQAALRAGEAATITFTLGESSTDFTAADVVATGGVLSGFSGVGTAYSATFTPAAGSTAAGGISVAAGVFTDAAGNPNPAASLSPPIRIDTAVPTITITTSRGTLKVGETATITFTASEPLIGFAPAGIVVGGGTLSGFSGGGTTYTATFTPAFLSTLDGTIAVPVGAAADAAGNGNAAVSLSQPIRIDTVLPTVSIASSRGALKAGETATITFTLSEASTSFTAADVTARGGTLSAFAGSGRVYSAVFTPAAGSTAPGTVAVAAGRFTAGGKPNAAGSLSPALAVDTVSPRVTVTSSLTAVRAGETATITFTTSEAVAGFTVADVAATGGSLSQFAGSGSTYTASFTPTAGFVGYAGVTVAASRFADAAGNPNTAGALVSTALAVDAAPPTLSITSNVASLSRGRTASLTFRLSEASTTFTAADVVVRGGTLTSFTGRGAVYGATFVPTDDSTADGMVTVAAGRFTDAAGNGNAAAALVTPIAIDTVAPMVAIGSDVATLTARRTARITFTLSEASTTFTLAAVTVANGTLANFSGSGSSYTATFTPRAAFKGTATIGVAAGRFTDRAGNANLAGTLAPGLIIDT